MTDDARRADQEFMRRALALAERGWGQTAPNPMVGAVVVPEVASSARDFTRASATRTPRSSRSTRPAAARRARRST